MNKLMTLGLFGGFLLLGHACTGMPEEAKHQPAPGKPVSTDTDGFQTEKPYDQTSNALPPKLVVFAEKDGTITDEGQFRSENDQTMYSVSIHAGRTLVVKQVDHVIGKTISIRIRDPLSNNVETAATGCTDHIKVSPTLAGDYQVSVSQCQNGGDWVGAYSIKFSAY